MLDLEDSGRQIGKKLLSLLSPNQKKELAQFVRDYEAGDIPADLPYHVSNLRRKLRVSPDLPDYVKSVYGIGYKFEEK